MTERTSFGTADSFAAAWEMFTEEVAEKQEAGDETTESSAEVQEALKAFYDKVKSDLAENADEYVYIIKDALAIEKSLKVEAARLTARAKQFAEKAARVKETLRYAMETSDILKLKTQKHLLSVRNPGGKAPIDIYEEIETLPKKYLYEEVLTKVDKDLLREDLKAGVSVEGACLIARDKILVIK